MFKEITRLFSSDDLLSQALDTCHEMLDIDLEMFKESKNSLRELDTAEIPIDIYAMDQKINSFERDVRRNVMTHLAVSGTNDISSGLVMVSVVIDIERIGDYTKNIYDLAVNHPKRLEAQSFESNLKDINKWLGEFEYDFKISIDRVGIKGETEIMQKKKKVKNTL